MVCARTGTPCLLGVWASIPFCTNTQVYTDCIAGGITLTQLGQHRCHINIREMIAVHLHSIYMSTHNLQPQICFVVICSNPVRSRDIWPHSTYLSNRL